MATLGITKPAFNSGAGFTTDDIAAYLKKKCRFYYSIGTIDTDPADADELLGLYDPLETLTCVYLPLGDMDAEIGSSVPKQDEEDKDFGKILGEWKVPLTLNSLQMNPSFLTFIDSTERMGKISVLVVPDGNEGAEEPIYFAYSGMTLTVEPGIEHNGKTSKTKLIFSRNAALLTEIIHFARFEAEGA